MTRTDVLSDQQPTVGGRWSGYGTEHTVGAAGPSGWTPACDMRMRPWSLRAHATDSSGPVYGPPRESDKPCEHCAAGVQAS